VLSNETILTFMLASILLSYAPGPDNIFVLMQSAIHGRKAGLIVTLGLCSGLVVHTIAVTLGVAAIFQVSAVAFTALKVLGALYLVYLAWLSFKAGTSVLKEGKPEKLSNTTLYKRGMFMSITNPKLAIFFMAFLPQFADPAQGSLSLQLLLLGGLFIVAGFVVMSSIAFLSGAISGWFKESRVAQSVINKLAGVVFLGLALKLVTSER
jgi:threonine/homoserine/homoserine lactone efflux protein